MSELADDELLQKQRAREQFEREREQKRLEAKQKLQAQENNKNQSTQAVTEEERLAQKRLEREQLELQKQQQRLLSRTQSQTVNTLAKDESAELLKKQLERQRLEEEREQKRLQTKNQQASTSKTNPKEIQTSILQQLSEEQRLIEKQLERERLEEERQRLQQQAKLVRLQSSGNARGSANKPIAVDNRIHTSTELATSPSSPLAIVSHVVENTPPGSPLSGSPKSPLILITCSICDKQITGKYLESSDGKKIHPECKPKKKYICTKCGEPITGAKVNAKELYWHTKCFMCTYCGKELKTTFVLKKNKAFCSSECHKNMRNL